MAEIEESSAHGIKGTLTKRIGPLPVWGWGAVLIGGTAAFLIIRSKKGSATASGAADFGQSTFGGGGGGGGGGASGGGASGGGGGTFDNGGGGGGTSPSGGNLGPSDSTVSPAPVNTRHAGVNEGGLTYVQNAFSAGGEDKYISTAVSNIAATVERSNTTVAANLGTDAQNRAAVSQLTARGYTSGYYGGQVYAARNNQEYFNGLPTEARNNLARLLVAMGAK